MLNDAKRVEKGRAQLLDLIKKYGQNMLYNRTMRFNFGNPSMTYENQLIPYQYYRFVELYSKYGGDQKKVDEVLKQYGLDREELKRDYERYIGARNAQQSGADGLTWDDFEREIAKYCEIANEMATLPPDDYAARSADEKAIDSVLYSVIEYYLQSGGKEENLQKYEQYQRLDKARAKRLSDMSQGM